MIDFKTDPRFNIPANANLAELPVEIIGQYVSGKGPKGITDPIFYAGDFNNIAAALIELRKVGQNWKAEGGIVEYVDNITIKLLGGSSFAAIAFYTIDMLPYDGKAEDWDV